MRLPSRTWCRATGMVALAVLALGASGCSLPTFGAPDPASEEGDRILHLWQGFFLTGLGVGAIVWGLLIVVLIRFRRRGRDDTEIPNQKAYNIPVEVLYTVVPIGIVAVLFGFSVAVQTQVDSVDSDADAVRVEVVGFQWSWEFHYTDAEVTVVGGPGQPPEMVLPVGRPAHLTLMSTDVNHSFWVPDFLSKRDLIPGVDNTIQVTPTETGSYVGRCAEFCGLDHWRMYYSVRVVTEEEFVAWMDEHGASAEAAAP